METGSNGFKENIRNNNPADRKISRQRINLPKGGGSIHGLGENFQVQEFSGTAGFSLPIPLSPCRDFTPQLTLTYSSGLGNSPWGLGFSLSVPSISRKTSNTIPQYRDRDVFILSEAGDLVPVEGSVRSETLSGINYQVIQYRPRKDTLFSWIEYWEPVDITRGDQAFWIVINRDHIVNIFGKTSQAKIADLQNPTHVFQWLLEESYDAKGQHHLYFYKQENSIGIPNVIYEQHRDHNRLANRYLQTIRYGNITPISNSIVLTQHSSLTHPKDWHFEVVFDYGEYTNSSGVFVPNYQPDPTNWTCRTDPFSNYRAGFEIRTYRLCRHILMYHRFLEIEIEGSPQLIDSLSFNYQTNAAGLMEMTEVQRSGWIYDFINGYRNQSLPPLKLAYTLFTPSKAQFSVLEQIDQSNLSGLNNPPYALVSLYGEGIPGVFYGDDQSTYYQEPLLLQSSIEYARPTKINVFPITRRLTQSGVSLMDVTGNGQADLVLTDNGLTGFYEVNPDRSWQDYRAFKHSPNDVHQPGQEWVDLTGSGLNDLVQLSTQGLRVYPARGRIGFDEPLLRKFEPDWPSGFHTDLENVVTFADMSGSGTPSLVQIHNGSVIYWPSLGYGRLGPSVIMNNAPYFGPDFSMTRLFLADLDGSGTTDLIYFQEDEVVIYLNESGNQFSSQAIRIPLPTVYHSLSQIDIADILGIGTQCILISEPAHWPNPRHWYCDLSRRIKPYLLETIDNNLGAITEIQYSTSVQYYLKDKQAGLSWVTSLPFPVQVVAKITHHDEITHSTKTTLYEYHHGYYDPQERTFAGFGRIDRQESEFFPQDSHQDDPRYVAPLLSRTWYYTGAPGQNQATYSKEFYSGDKMAFPFPDTVFADEGYESVDEGTRREGFEVLEGQVLRTELYEFSNDLHRACPYIVQESNYLVTLKQPKICHQYAIFILENRETLSYNYERNPADPQIHHDVVLKSDDFGNIIQQCHIAYGRRKSGIDVLDDQKKIKVVCNLEEYINHVIPRDSLNSYLLGIVAQTRNYYCPNIPTPQANFLFAVLQSEINDALRGIDNNNPSTQNAQLLDWQKNNYVQIETDGTNQLLPLGKVTLPVLLGQEQMAEIYQVDAEEIFAGRGSNAVDIIGQLSAGGFQKDTENNYWWNPGLIEEYFGANSFYLPLQTRDSLTNKSTQYEYDNYCLLLTLVNDALNNKTKILRINYQQLQAEKIQDINGNFSEIQFDPLGRVVYTSYYGLENNIPVGFSSLDGASWSPPHADMASIIQEPQNYLKSYASYFYYDDTAWIQFRKPACTLQLLAEHYATSSPSNTACQILLNYYDGFDRLLQTKQKVEPGDSFIYQDIGETPIDHTENRWLTSDAKAYNYNDQPIKSYEPYYLDRWEYVENPLLMTFGAGSTFYYDATDRLKKTLTAKGFMIIQSWTAWETFNADENRTLKNSPYYRDNKDEHTSEPPPYYDSSLSAADRQALIAEAEFYADMADKTIVNNLGYAIVAEKQWKSKLGNEELKTLQTQYTVDVKGQVLSVKDPRDIVSFAYFYSLSGQLLKNISVDAGTRWVLENFLDKPIYICDSKLLQTLTAYDELYRPLTISIIQPQSQHKIIVEKFEYGEKISQSGKNLRGKLYIHYDQAGKMMFPSYSLREEIFEQQRWLIKLAYCQQIIDWGQNTDSLLDTSGYFQLFQYDGLGRMLTKIDKVENDKNKTNSLKEYVYCTDYAYLISGRLKSISVQYEGQVIQYVSNVIYNAKSQRQVIEYGNKTRTEYQYEARTFRLLKQTTSLTITQNKVQDLSYQYDPVGNVLKKTNGLIGLHFYRNQSIDGDCSYVYNSLYQLEIATGREETDIGYELTPSRTFKLRPADRNDHIAQQSYTEYYTYDASGNLYKMNHVVNGQNSKNWTRELVVSSQSNRAVISTIQGHPGLPNPEEYFDVNGNQIQTQNFKTLNWDYQNNLQKVDIVARTNGNNDSEYYIYDGNNQRVRKIRTTYVSLKESQNQVQVEETIYLDDFEHHLKWQGTAENNLNLTIKEEYHSKRIIDPEIDEAVATRDQWIVGKPFSNYAASTTTLIRYHLTDRRSSCTLEFSAQYDSSGNWVSTSLLDEEEYYPYGGTAIFKGSLSASLLKFYRYSGKERDSTGFYYYGARYYDFYVGRWLSADPGGPVDGLNLYQFVVDNPIEYEDMNGMGKTQRNQFIDMTKKRMGTPTSWAKKNLDPKRAHNPKIKKAVGKWNKKKRNSPGIPASKRIDAAHVVSDKGIRGVLAKAMKESTKATSAQRKKIIKYAGKFIYSLEGPKNTSAQKKIWQKGHRAYNELIKKGKSANFKSIEPFIKGITTSAMNNLRPGLGNLNSSIQEHIDPNLDASGNLSPISRRIVDAYHNLVKNVKHTGPSTRTKNGTDLKTIRSTGVTYTQSSSGQ